MKLLLSLALALGGLQGAAQTTQGTGMIAGSVVRPGGEGIAGVDILLVGPLTGPAANAAASNPLMIAEIAVGASIPQARVLTEADGGFVFRSLAPGQYTVRAQREGHFGATPAVTGTLVSIVTQSVSLSAGVPTPEVHLTLVRGATISGRLRDPNGQPGANLSVTAYQITYREGRQTLNAVSTRTSDDRGDYRLYWLAPGEYYVATVARAVIFPPSQDAPVRTFYPSAADFRTALPLTVADGAEASGMDIQLRTTRTYKVSGRIVNTLPNPPAANAQTRGVSPTLYLLPRDTGMLIEPFPPTVQNFASNPGDFEIRGVLEGAYDLVATVPDSGGRPYPGRVRIEVGNQDLAGVTLSIHPGMEVKVRILVDGKLVAAPPPPSPAVTLQFLNTQGVVVSAPAPSPAPPPPTAVVGSPPVGTTVRAMLRSKETYAALFDTAVANATTDSSGALVFPSVPEGPYSVTVSAVPANSYVADIREGGVSIYDTGFIAGERSQPLIDVVISSGAQSIKGVVRKADGRPSESTTVVLVPAAARRQNASLYRTIRTNPAGEFTLNNLAPGDYKLFAWEGIQNTAYMNASFMERYESRGRAVRLANGGESNFELTVISREEGR